ncbi:hypothetical protein [Mycobacterium riyadhense]|uniref:hypothetical protein n=1 Tax=Mycobacterium riyadhense TaxID=486698 RepID=UPI0019517ED1|nr:hypothetical protein [Mycobacterium riyadhense]
MAEFVEAAHPLLQVALLHPQREALPRGAVPYGGDADDGVGGATAVCMVGIPQQPGVVAVGKHRHPAVSKCGREVVFGTPAYLVHLVEELHAETSHTRRDAMPASRIGR